MRHTVKRLANDVFLKARHGTLGKFVLIPPVWKLLVALPPFILTPMAFEIKKCSGIREEVAATQHKLALDWSTHEPLEDDVARIFGPFVTQEFQQDDPVWVRTENNNANIQRKRRVRRRLVGWMPILRRRRRTQATIRLNYHKQWIETPVEQQVGLSSPLAACVWRGQGMYARRVGIKRVHLLYLMRLMEVLQPSRVLEVGCGNGLNIFLLAARFPKMSITGLELTRGGVSSAQRIKRLARLPSSLTEFTPEPVVDLNPSARISIVQGSASAMPFRSGQFDLVYTCLALEQMEEVRKEALSEIVRVSHDYVAMIEPFREWNNAGPQRDYIIANDYFSGQITDLSQFGLDVIYTNAALPCPLTFRPGLAVCRRSNKN